MTYIIIDSAGTILRSVQCPESIIADQLQPGETYIPGIARDLTQYVLNGVVTNKPALGATIDTTTVIANGTDVSTISGLPNPTQATVLGGGTTSNVTVTDGTLELTFDTPGTYRVQLSSVNKLPQEYSINAI